MLDHHSSHNNLSIHLPDYLSLNALNKHLPLNTDPASLSPPSDAASSADDPDHSFSPPPSALTPPPFLHSAALSYPQAHPYNDHRRSASYEDDQLYAHRPRTAGSPVSNNPPTPQSQQYSLPYHDITYSSGSTVRPPVGNQQLSPSSPASDLAGFHYTNRVTVPNHRLSLDSAAAASSSAYAFEAARRQSEPHPRFRTPAQQHQAPGAYQSLPSISSSLPSNSTLHQQYPSHHLSTSLHHHHSPSSSYPRESAFADVRRQPVASVAADEFSPRPGPARHYTYPSSSSHNPSQWSSENGYSSESEGRRQSVSGGNGVVGGPLTTEPMVSAVMTATSAVATPQTGLSVGLGIGMEGDLVGEFVNVAGEHDDEFGHPPLSPIDPRSSPSNPSEAKSSPEVKSGHGRPGGKSSKTYSFVALPGNAVKKRPRRRYDEIERLYRCSFPNCAKAYGTLNHLNAHVTMQKHGSKRSPAEFKELRKQWRQAKKEAEDEDRERERQERAVIAVAQQQQHQHAHLQGVLSVGTNGAHHSSYMLGIDPAYEHAMSLGAMRRRGSQPYPSPHHSHQPTSAGAGYTYAAAGRGGLPYEEEQHFASAALSSPAEEVQRVYHSQHQHAQHSEYEDEMYYHHHQNHQHAGAHPASASAGDPWPHTRTQMTVAGRGTLQQQQSSYYASTPTSTSWEPSTHGHPHSHAREDEEPLLTSHVSLGSNRLPPDSTLLTALPGFGGGRTDEVGGVERWDQADV